MYYQFWTLKALRYLFECQVLEKDLTREIFSELINPNDNYLTNFTQVELNFFKSRRYEYGQDRFNEIADEINFYTKFTVFKNHPKIVESKEINEPYPDYLIQKIMLIHNLNCFRDGLEVATILHFKRQTERKILKQILNERGLKEEEIAKENLNEIKLQCSIKYKDIKIIHKNDRMIELSKGKLIFDLINVKTIGKIDIQLTLKNKL